MPDLRLVQFRLHELHLRLLAVVCFRFTCYVCCILCFMFLCVLVFYCAALQGEIKILIYDAVNLCLESQKLTA